MHNFVHILIGILPIIYLSWGVGSTSITAQEQGSTNCVEDKLMDIQCSTYCYKVVKPMLDILQQCQGKDASMKLHDELAALKQELAVYKERESKNKELLSISSKLDGLSKQIEQLSNARNEKPKEEKQENGTNTRNKKPKDMEQKEQKQENRTNICLHDEGFSTWTVIQRRTDDTNFFRNWSDYRVGFGDPNASFFIGLEKLHQLTMQEPNELIVQMKHFNGKVRFARYDNFAIGGEDTQYQLLSLGLHSGNASDALRRSKLMKFTTLDRDNDQHLYSNCAVINHDAWWHRSCSDCNLNGIYNDNYHCLSWSQMSDNSDCLKTVRMLVRPKNYCK